jgi:hypothetical protein
VDGIEAFDHHPGEDQRGGKDAEDVLDGLDREELDDAAADHRVRGEAERHDAEADRRRDPWAEAIGEARGE